MRELLRRWPNNGVDMKTQCEALVTRNPQRLGKYIAANTRRCKMTATTKTKHGNFCTRHAKKL